MKKLMIIAAVVCAAFASHAAAFDWKTSATGKIYEAGSTTLLASGTAYIFDSTAVTQQAVLDAFVADGIIASGSLANKSISAGAISTLAGGAASFSVSSLTAETFFAVINDDLIYISGINTTTGADVGTTTITFNAKSSSQAAFMQADGGYTTAGWYQAVPEPTSGLLMLLGMAGLALRRRRA